MFERVYVFEKMYILSSCVYVTCAYMCVVIIKTTDVKLK